MSEIILKIDYREHKLIDNVSRYLDKKKDKYDYLTFEKCNLDIGDIIIEYKDIKKELVSYFIIERKTITDMISSIKDGRYKEQKSRICAHVDNLNKKDKLCHFFYLLEGFEEKYRNKSSDEKMLFGSWISMQFRDNINCVRLVNEAETLVFLFRLIERCKNKISDFFDIFKKKNIKKVSLHCKSNNIKQNSDIIISKIDSNSKNNLDNNSKNNINNNSENNLSDNSLDNKLSNNNKYINNESINTESINNESINNESINNECTNIVVFNEETCKNNLKQSQIKQVSIIDKKEENTTKSKSKSKSKSKNKSKSKSNANKNPDTKSSSEQNIDLISLEKEKRKLELDQYMTTIKSQKKQNMTPQLYQKLILCNIPGVSNTISCQIIEHFSSYKKLVDFVCIDIDTDINTDIKTDSDILKNNNNEDIFKKENIKNIIKDLSNIKLKMGSEKKERNLGPSLSKKIFMYLNNL